MESPVIFSSGPMAEVAAVSQLVSQERAWRDRGEWDKMRSAYLDDAEIRVTWFAGNVDDFIAGSRRWSGALTKHRLSPPLVTVRGDRAIAETSVCLELRTEFDGVLIDLVSSVRLISRVSKTRSGWKLASMDAIYEKDQLAPVNPADTLVIDTETLSRYRSSYKFLAYCGRGSLPDDIPGDDRPDLTAPIYADAQAWLAP